MKGSAGLLGALGVIGIVFAVLNVFIGLFGAGFDMFWIGANLVAGVLLLATAAALNFDAVRERLRSGEAHRVEKYGTSAILSTVFMLAILGLLGFLSVRYNARFDWSEAGVHSLSDQSVKVLDGLERDVHALALYAPMEVAPVRDLLERYAYQSDRFHVEIADPNERPELLERHGISPEELGQGLVRIGLGDESTLVTEVTEESLTNAMVKLTRTGEKKIYFLEGHNERPLEGEGGATEQGFTRAADALRNENYQVETLLLAAQGDVPQDADVVIVAGATRPLLGAEHGALQRYLERGGSLLVLLDPRAKTDLVEDLRRWGVDVGDDVIVDRQLALFGRATSPFASGYDEDHPITRDMRETTLFHMARSVRPGADGEDFTEIVFTGESSWAERDLKRFYEQGDAELGDEDLRGPVAVAVAGVPAVGDAADGSPPEAAEEEGEAGATPDTAPRLVVFGDADFASNELVEAYRNRDLFLNAVNWLMGDVEAISIRPRVSRASRFQLTSEQFMRIRSLSIFVLPEVIAVLGVWVWWTRRRAPGR